MQLNQNQQIDMLDFTTQNHTEYVTRDSMNELLKQGSPEMMKMSPSNNAKSMGKRPQQSAPRSTENITDAYGVPSMVLSLLEVGRIDQYLGVRNPDQSI